MSEPKRTCVVEGCDKPEHAKGYCKRHYGQIWRNGCIIEDCNPSERKESEEKREEYFKKMQYLNKYKKLLHEYNIVVGYKNRIHYRQEITQLIEEAQKHNVDLIKEFSKQKEKTTSPRYKAVKIYS